MNDRKEYLINKLKQLHKKLKRPPDLEDIIMCNDIPKIEDYIKEFNTLINCYNRAKIKHGYSNLEVKRLNNLKKLGVELGKTPTKDDLNRCNYTPSYTTYVNTFDYYSKSCLLAGLIPNKVYFLSGPNPSTNELLNLLKIKKDELNRTPTTKDIEKDIRFPSIPILCDIFGSIPKYCLAANIKPNKLKLTGDEMIKRLKLLSKDLGKIPKMKDVNNCIYTPHSQTYINHFTTFKNACNLAGLNNYKSKTDKLAKSLKKLTLKLNRLPKIKDINNSDLTYHYNTYYNHFGGGLNVIFKKTGIYDLLNCEGAGG